MDERDPAQILDTCESTVFPAVVLAQYLQLLATRRVKNRLTTLDDFLVWLISAA